MTDTLDGLIAQAQKLAEDKRNGRRLSTDERGVLRTCALRMIDTGLDVRQIAEKLGLSTESVGMYVSERVKARHSGASTPPAPPRPRGRPPLHAAAPLAPPTDVEQALRDLEFNYLKERNRLLEQALRRR